MFWLIGIIVVFGVLASVPSAETRRFIKFVKGGTESDKTVYFTPKSLEVLKKNLYCSPHTWRLINNPVHAHRCTGQDCIDATNKAGQ